MPLDLTYQALADPPQRAMLQWLPEGSALTVGDLAGPLAIGLPTVIKHPGACRARYASEDRPYRVVALAPGPMAAGIAWRARTDTVWSARLAHLGDLVEGRRRQGRARPHA